MRLSKGAVALLAVVTLPLLAAEPMQQLVALMNNSLSNHADAVGPKDARFYFESIDERLALVLSQQVMQHPLVAEAPPEQRLAQFAASYQYAQLKSDGAYGDRLSQAMTATACLLPETAQVVASGVPLTLRYVAEDNNHQQLLAEYSFERCE